MSVPTLNNPVLWRIALKYSSGMYSLSTLPSTNEGNAIKAFALQQAPKMKLAKKVASFVSSSKAGAMKLLKLHSQALELGCEFPELTSKLTKESQRLTDRALVLSQRHGAKARVRVETIKALHKAGFVDSGDFKLIEHNMLKISDVRHHLKSDDSIRWEILKKAYSGIVPSEALPPQTKPAPKKHKPMICKASRRKAGIKVRKPITKAAFLLLEDSYGNLLPASAKKQAIKAERTAKAQQRRRGFKANGGSKVGGPGEGVTVRNADLKLCAAGHASSGDKVAK